MVCIFDLFFAYYSEYFPRLLFDDSALMLCERTKDPPQAQGILNGLLVTDNTIIAETMVNYEPL